MGNFWSSNYEKEVEFLRKHSIDNENLQCWNKEQLLRLERLMSGDKIYDDITTFEDDDSVDFTKAEVTFQSEFENFCMEHVSWNDPSVVLFWKEYQTIIDLMVIRRQKSGLCCMHAPVLLQHYLVSIAAGSPKAAFMIDIARYIDKYRKHDTLLQYLKDDRCGNSEDFLREIFASSTFKKKSYNMDTLNDSLDEFLCKLKIYPALVSRFYVDENFINPVSGTSFLSASQFNYDKRKGRHAMVLIGYRRHKNELIFLLQNWWKGRFFIEVSQSYLTACEATITFVESDMIKIPDYFPVVRSIYAETSADCGETYDEILC
jgi:hypothetical protein